MKRIEALETLARDLMVDGEEPDLFFVSAAGNIQMITTDWEAAYEYWRQLVRFGSGEVALENRTFGTIASRHPDTEDQGRLGA